LCESKVNEYKSLKKTCLKKLFPQNRSNIPELRFPGFTGAWEQRKLGEISSSFEYGLNAAAKEFDGKNKYIRITDIDDETRLFLTSDLTSPDVALKGADNYKLCEGDIVFARTGASVGKTYIYRNSDGLVYYAGFLIRARIKPEYCAEFVFQNTLSRNYEKFIAITSQRSGQPGVNAQEYGDYELMVPQYDEQQAIGNFLSSLDNLITLHQREAEEYTRFKKAMTQLLLTGIVRMK
jgi:type I restriction enzyme S subunit